MMILRTLRSTVAAGVAATLCACAVGPGYHTPATAPPERYMAAPPAASAAASGAATTASPDAVDPAQWWRSLHDPELDSLIDRAIQANPDLDIALTRLQEARERQVVFAGDALPVVAGDAAAGRGTGSDMTRAGAQSALRAGDNKGALPIKQIAGFTATWELDLFGGIRREIEAGHYDMQAAAAARDAVLVTVAADVARDYVDLRGLQMRQAILQANIDTTQQSRDLAQSRYDRGITNELDLQLANREYSRLRAELPVLQSDIEAEQSSLATLLNQYPEQLQAELAKPGVIPDLPADVAAGMPLDLLKRRPDIRESERRLAAATARIGVATSNLFPKVGLTGALGVQSSTIGLNQGTHIWNFGPSVYWPLLDFGSLDAQISVADLQAHEQLITYRRTVIGAVKNADDAIASYVAQQQRLRDLSDAVAASQRALDLAQQRYDRGLTDYLNVVDAQRQQYSLEDEYTSAQQAAADGFVYLYRALGGGWERYQQLSPIHHPQPAVVAAFARLVANDDPQRHPLLDRGMNPQP
jgi:NodT family efflux transporter outer membrane factor (OMF) lipoprotein